MASAIRSGFSGSSVMRTPVASWTALAIAAGAGDDRRLADAAGAEGTGRRGHLDDDRLDVRQVGRGELPVVEQARVRQPPVLVEHQPLGQRDAEALHRAALHLALDAERVDGLADVLDDHEVVDRHLAGVRVHLDPRELGREAGRLLGEGRVALPSTGGVFDM